MCIIKTAGCNFEPPVYAADMTYYSKVVIIQCIHSNDIIKLIEILSVK